MGNLMGNFFKEKDGIFVEKKMGNLLRKRWEICKEKDGKFVKKKMGNLLRKRWEIC